MRKANEHQVDGSHYRKDGAIQHWDYAHSNEFDYFQGQITKYVSRWKKKNGLKDLEKAMHFIEKYIEIETQKQETIDKRNAEEAKAQGVGIIREPLPPKIHTWGGPKLKGEGKANSLQGGSANQPYPFGFDPATDI